MVNIISSYCFDSSGNNSQRIIAWYFGDIITDRKTTKQLHILTPFTLSAQVHKTIDIHQQTAIIDFLSLGTSFFRLSKSSTGSENIFHPSGKSIAETPAVFYPKGEWLAETSAAFYLKGEVLAKTPAAFYPKGKGLVETPAAIYPKGEELAETPAAFYPKGETFNGTPTNFPLRVNIQNGCVIISTVHRKNLNTCSYNYNKFK
jgi:hypothetical protein